MSQSTVYNAELSAYLDVTVAQAAYEWGCYAADLYSKRRSRHIIAAKRQVVKILRMMVLCNGDSYRFRKPGGPEEMFPGYKPLSYPIIARLLGIDHTAVMRLLRPQKLGPRERATADA